MTMAQVFIYALYLVVVGFLLVRFLSEANLVGGTPTSS